MSNVESTCAASDSADRLAIPRCTAVQVREQPVFERRHDTGGLRLQDCKRERRRRRMARVFRDDNQKTGLPGGRLSIRPLSRGLDS